MKDKKKIVIGTLCALIMIMAVGYALLSQQLSINGTANITSTWKIQITNITEKERHGGVTEKSKSYDAMTANFDVGFTSPGDYITYDVEVTNSGTLDAVIEKINVVTNDNPAIIYTTSGIKRGDVIEQNSKKYLTVKIEYASSVTTQPQTNNNALTLQLFTAQNLGQVQPEYDTYSIGDKITFAGSDWYVIKDSSEDEDYVTLMKEKILTNAELGNYACSSNDNTISFSSSSNNFNQSPIKTILNQYADDNNLNSKLKEIEGYRIRLVSFEELQNNLGLSSTMTASWYEFDLSESYSWVYENFGGKRYWTMTPNSNDNMILYHVDSDLRRVKGMIIFDCLSVRPVINLYKSAIE